MIEIVSWNVNGINAAIKKGLLDYLKKENAQIYCLQEIRANEKTLGDKLKDILNDGYLMFWNQAEKKGYSGVMTLTKIKPIREIKGFGTPEFDGEGRVLTLEFPTFYLVNAYVVNAQRGLTRLEYKLRWNKTFREFLLQLDKQKPVIACGDFNVAHKEIDLKNPKSNINNAGFTIEERKDFDLLLESGFVDVFRHFNKESGNYTWWSYRNNARARNIGWRIDYFIASKRIIDKMNECTIQSEVMGSDHCPISLKTSIL